jgi:DNA-binding response OmpR family regulator
MIDTIEKKILVVDDEPAIVRLAASRLRAHGFRVVTAEDGEGAIMKVEEEHPSLMLLDVMMPGMSGYQVIRHLRQKEEFLQMPVVLFTVKAFEPNEVKRVWNSSTDGYLRKPFLGEDLIDEIETCLRVTHG